jgi:antitoxin ParD1/3/4
MDISERGASTMTMHVNLSDEMEGFIRSKVASGFYGNATEVIRDAVRRMQAEEARVAAWQAAVRVGDDQLARGESVDYTPATLNQIKGRAKKAIGTGKPMDPDVLP